MRMEGREKKEREGKRFSGKGREKREGRRTNLQFTAP